MGICASKEDKDERRRNQEIENQLQKEQLAARTEVKMLLLGTN